MGGVFRALCLLTLVAACTAHISMSGVPTLRLRGGAWGQKEQQMQQMAQEMPEDRTPVQMEEPAQAGPPQINLVQHAVEYALAGSFDGIRSGVGQAVGGQMAGWVGGALANAGRGTGLAFLSVFGSLPFMKRFKRKGGAAQNQATGAQPMQPTGVCVCFVTVPSDEVANVIAQTLIQAGLAACVNQVPGITSTYVWAGKMQRDSESLLIIKTNREQLAEVALVVKDKHPFECPEFICLDVGAGLPDYLAWVRSHALPQQAPL